MNMAVKAIFDVITAALKISLHHAVGREATKTASIT